MIAEHRTTRKPKRGEGGKYLGARLCCWFKESGYGQPTWQNRLTKGEKTEK